MIHVCDTKPINCPMFLFTSVSLLVHMRKTMVEQFKILYMHQFHLQIVYSSDLEEMAHVSHFNFLVSRLTRANYDRFQF